MLNFKYDLKVLVSFTVRDALRHWVHQVWGFRVGWPAQLHPDPSTDLLACRIPVPLYAITGTREAGQFEVYFHKIIYSGGR